MEPQPADHEKEPPDMFIIVPLTIPVLLTYAAFRNPRVGMSILGILALIITASTIIALPAVVGAPIIAGLGLMGLWWLRWRLQRDDQQAGDD